MRLNDHEPAREDYAKCVELDPENAAAKKRMAACANHIRAQRAKGPYLYDVRSGWGGGEGVPKKQMKGTKSADL